MNPDLFRKAALEHLTSPERLDSLMEVVSLKLWIALAACMAAVLAGLTWGFLGTVADTARGNGMLLQGGGLINLETGTVGNLELVLVRPGDRVEQGQPLAVLRCPELEARIREAEARRAALERERGTVPPLLAREHRAQLAAHAGQLALLQKTAGPAQERVGFLEQRVAALKAAPEPGRAADRLDEAELALAAAQERLAALRNQGHELSGREASAAARLAQRSFDLDRDIADIEGRISLLRQQLGRDGSLASPVPGRVVEVLKDPGEYLPAGTPVLRIEATSAPLLGYLLVPRVGKQIRPGMVVQLEPAGIRPEEFGRMLGRVRSVSPAPLSLEAVQEKLKNPTLAAQLGAGGSAYLVEVVPDRDPATPTGLRWTTRLGPPFQFGSGTLIAGQVRLRVQAPVTLMLPALRRWLDGAGDA